MDFPITFFEGVISFISPCTLPLLPVYLTYLTGGASEEKRRGRFSRPLGFVLGFTAVFVLLGLFAGTLGGLLIAHRRVIRIVCGVIVVLFGLAYLEIIPMNFLKGLRRRPQVNSFLGAVLFGMIYSVSLTPCIGAFLGSALMMAATSGTALRGTLLLLVYSLGMGVPFLLSALLMDRLTETFAWIKRHYGVINKVCGAFLILIGIIMAFGWLEKLMRLLT